MKSYESFETGHSVPPPLRSVRPHGDREPGLCGGADAGAARAPRAEDGGGPHHVVPRARTQLGGINYRYRASVVQPPLRSGWVRAKDGRYPALVERELPVPPVARRGAPVP